MNHPLPSPSDNGQRARAPMLFSGLTIQLSKNHVTRNTQYAIRITPPHRVERSDLRDPTSATLTQLFTPVKTLNDFLLA